MVAKMGKGGTVDRLNASMNSGYGAVGETKPLLMESPGYEEAGDGFEPSSV